MFSSVRVAVTTIRRVSSAASVSSFSDSSEFSLSVSSASGVSSVWASVGKLSVAEIS